MQAFERRQIADSTNARKKRRVILAVTQWTCVYYDPTDIANNNNTLTEISFDDDQLSSK